MIPPLAASAGFVYITYLAFCPEAKCPGRVKRKARVNHKVKLETEKIADLVDIEVSDMPSKLPTYVLVLMSAYVIRRPSSETTIYSTIQS